jgi:flagellar biosynthesis protein FlhG
LEPNLEASKPEGGLLRRIFRLGGASPPEPAPRREGCVVAFASGKGGTGKSFLASNVGVALHRLGRRVAIVDCDFGLANAHLLLGVNPRYTVQQLFDGAVSVAQALTPTEFGPGLLAGGSGVASLAELEARHMQVLGRALGWLAACHDAVLLDCPAGLSPQAMTAVLCAQHAVVVTNPEIAALTDAYALIKCLARQPARPTVHLVVNRVARPGLGPATFDRLADVSRRFAGCEIRYLGEVPEDPAVGQRRLGQPPLTVSHPECATSIAIERLVNCLDATTGGVMAQPIATGVEARMAAQLRRW